MPRVTQEYRDQRRQQILSAARRCFIREGFHKTSMTDILTEAEVSAGALYGHFTSKNEIIAAVAEDVIGQLVDRLEPIAAQVPSPGIDQMIVQMINSLEEFAFGSEGIARLAPSVWAEALRDDELAAVTRSKYGEIHALFSGVIAEQKRAGATHGDVDEGEAARLLVSTLLGYLLQRLLVGHIDSADYAAGLRLATPPP
ncbi:TetR/AcrR family transcriptional regulator [Spiractinospora alimapuensis]|uniref:TetR/AcrR family transcriptional regulator n=1 Tax=Spiractinospora alimapuensis TaxID=2820884 RepID=UPI001F1C9953|nr:TetR/AcrR family transcriptional regulator [Spiractinospora alimapuensis]QVQ51648.1 TetR/AcrR family transcriptional regulator [Spiractinospora alimapuensis]